jgi:hypothetical protein
MTAMLETASNSTGQLSLADAAVWYAKNGYPVFPCAPGAKEPLAGSRGFKDATCDVNIVREWWRKNPNSNIGMRTGVERNGMMLVVIDTDPRDDGNDKLDVLLAKYGKFPDTAMVMTGRGDGGMHYYFQTPVGVSLKSRLSDGKGIDVKSKDGYVMVPPSIHPLTGNSYQWEGSSDLFEGVAVADAPDWIVRDFSKGGDLNRAAPASTPSGIVAINPETIKDLRSALLSMRADDYDRWIRLGLALKDLGDIGRGLWMEWSAQSSLFDPRDAALKWDEFDPINIHYQSVFEEAQDAGWLNPLKTLHPSGLDSITNTEPFEVEIGDVIDIDPPAPEFIIGEIVPVGVVTLLGANGGTGKTTLAMMASVCVAMGIPFLGKPTKRCNVLFYSAEDANAHLRHRLSKICRHLKVDPRDLAANLTILDVTDNDPALFCETNEKGVKRGVTTAAYKRLKQYVEERGIDFLIIDNASDTYDANEIERARVRAFIRSLAQLIKERGGAVMLLSHVDKQTAGGTRSSQGYSGSTAWNNSVRSRLFMSESGDGVLMEHQKSNLGQKAEPLILGWFDGVLDLASARVELDGPTMQAHDRHRVTILRMIEEFKNRGEFISVAQTSPDNAFKKLSNEKEFPKKMGKAPFTSLLRDAERAGLIEREPYKTVDRKNKERWNVTEKGLDLIAPTAPTITESNDRAYMAHGAPPAPTCIGGMGGRSAHI